MIMLSFNQVCQELKQAEFASFRDMGWMFDCAFKGSAKSPIRTQHINPTLLPFAACVKFAFDQSYSGKITHLFGEVHIDPREGSMFQLKAEAMLEKTNFFISQ